MSIPTTNYITTNGAVQNDVTASNSQPVDGKSSERNNSCQVFHRGNRKRRRNKKRTLQPKDSEHLSNDTAVLPTSVEGKATGADTSTGKMYKEVGNLVKTCARWFGRSRTVSTEVTPRGLKVRPIMPVSYNTMGQESSSEAEGHHPVHGLLLRDSIPTSTASSSLLLKCTQCTPSVDQLEGSQPQCLTCTNANQNESSAIPRKRKKAKRRKSSSSFLIGEMLTMEREMRSHGDRNLGIHCMSSCSCQSQFSSVSAEDSSSSSTSIAYSPNSDNYEPPKKRLLRDHSTFNKFGDDGISNEIPSDQPVKDAIVTIDGTGHKPSSAFVALDCEMVGVGPRLLSALGRVSIVDYDGNVVLDKYVRPDNVITDYRTRWSGITPFHMRNAIAFEHAQKRVTDIIKDKIVIGHAIHNDLSVLRLKHPRVQIRDTSTYKPLRLLGAFSSSSPVSLKKLALSLLGYEIQCGRHCSVEDARVTMQLYQLVQKDWEDSMPEVLTTCCTDSPRTRSISECSTDSNFVKEEYMKDEYWEETEKPQDS